MREPNEQLTFFNTSVTRFVANQYAVL